MQYWPLVQSMSEVGRGSLGAKHTLVLFDNIVSAGSVEYTFLAAVFENESGDPVQFIASEVNQMAQTIGGGSHFLGLFDGSGHANLGSSNNWGDRERFFAEAIRRTSEAFGAFTPVDVAGESAAE